MKKFALVLAFLLCAAPLFAQTPRKVAYPVTPTTFLGFTHDGFNTENYGIRIDGGARTVITVQNVGASTTNPGWFEFETAFPALTPGLHVLIVDACNFAGCGLSDPFAVELVAVPAKPGSLRIVIKPGT